MLTPARARLALGLLLLPGSDGGRLLQAASSGELLEIPYGATVRLRGLQRQVELNGQTGHVKAFDKKADRYEVWLEGANKGARIRPANLEVLEAAHVGVKGHQGWLKMRDGQYGEKGMKVKISGLAKTRGLNGLVGIVQGFDTKGERYLVRVSCSSRRGLATWSNRRPRAFWSEAPPRLARPQVVPPAAPPTAARRRRVAGFRPQARAGSSGWPPPRRAAAPSRRSRAASWPTRRRRRQWCARPSARPRRLRSRTPTKA
ncbi:unnamed protein product [Prorocentrum cordatum]|uniref:Uncharacterized protein n=1 Tax=Prorocentrum cordatum TaxID=2364126 RepID=A0ABN9W1E2_9DINO|nr:unnamed protein product [Polarella glacialis]